MGELFRSQEMALCQFFLQAESAYSCISELGELGLVQFRDLNPEVNAFQRKFTNEVRRCNEMERKLRFLQKEIEKDKIPMLETNDNPPAPLPREMIDLESTFEKLEVEMKEINTNAEALKKNYLELTELKQILRKTHAFFDEMHETPRGMTIRGHRSSFGLSAATNTTSILNPSNLISDETFHDLIGSASPNPPSNTTNANLIDIEEGGHTFNNNDNRKNSLEPRGSRTGFGSSLRLGFVAGVILRERFPAFEKLLWRACRGNVFLRRSDIDIPLEDPITGDKVNKVVFMIFFQGDQLRNRVKKICEAFRATLYPCPETAAERREMEMGVMTRLEDLSTVLSQTQEHRHRVLVAAAKNIKIWYIKVRKIKAIYHSLNMFSIDVTNKCLIAEGWCPVPELDKIRMALKRGEENSGSTVPCIMNKMEIPSSVSPPTYNKVNKYTSGFQNIVDAYGAAKYREVNPAPYTIVSFPFLFSVMFGDAGHGLLMTLFAGWMCWREKALASLGRSETFGLFFAGRYIMLAMGLFSIYTGLLYNDIFSKAFNVFGTSWYSDMPDTFIPSYPGELVPVNMTSVTDTASITLDPAIIPRVYRGSPYPYSIDPVWILSSNKITFSNSYKMKISIILGVIHMMLGICLSMWNHTYFKHPLNIWFEFIPQFLFLFCLFGYLCIVIFIKWIKVRPWDSRCAPSLLINLINMFLVSYPPPTKPGECSPYLYAGQKPLQLALVLIAVLCIPWMLLPKPLILRRKHKHFGKRMTQLMGAENPVVDVSHSTSPDVHGARRLTKQFVTSSTTSSVKPRPSNSPDRRLSVVNEKDEHGLLSPNNVNNPARSSISSSRDTVNGTTPKPIGSESSDDGEEKFNFGEIFIEQCIHTIEFCLGCLSHTASYLRLWALSLAHAQLSEVLWQMVFHIGFTFTSSVGGLVLFCVFAVWAVLTVAILLFMEGLSAFLHALRLHWVEFQSKFYEGSGYLFEPFSFQYIIDSVAMIGHVNE